MQERIFLITFVKFCIKSKMLIKGKIYMLKIFFIKTFLVNLPQLVCHIFIVTIEWRCVYPTVLTGWPTSFPQSCVFNLKSFRQRQH